MEDLGSHLSTWFWNPDIWLPPNVDWNTFKEEKIINSTTVIKPEHFANFSDLWYPLPIALCFIITRVLVEKYILRPLALRLGITDKPRRQPRPNNILEHFFKTKRKISHGEARDLARQSGLSEIEVERWFRDKRRASMPTTITKFCEGGWRFIFYSSVFLYGLQVLASKPWLWDTGACWAEYPYHTMESDVWWYYMIELGFYWSLSITQWIDVKRKDFLQNFVHHNVTILLMMFSWSCHFTRIGSLVLIIHDCSDPLLELAKLCKYAKRDQVAEVVFGVFTVLWCTMRCYVFPTRVLWSTMHAAEAHVDMFPGYYIFNCLLIILQILNVMWTVLILKIAISGLLKGNTRDSRSDSEDTDSEEENRKKAE